MNKVEFSNILKSVVSQAAIDSTLENLREPPGRNPDADLLAQSDWYKSLAPTDRDMLSKVISDAVHESIFGFLCVLDGVRSISDSEEANGLVLSRHGVQLNSESDEYLHDIYNDT